MYRFFSHENTSVCRLLEGNYIRYLIYHEKRWIWIDGSEVHTANTKVLNEFTVTDLILFKRLKRRLLYVRFGFINY